MGKVIIDVREPEEFASGHVEGALNIPSQALRAGSRQLDGVPKDTEIILYCRTGNRSSVAMSILAAQGYTNIKNGINREYVEAKYGKNSY